MPSLLLTALAFVCFLSLPVVVHAQADVSAALRFDSVTPEGRPVGWGGGPAGTLSVDSAVVHVGRYAGRIERDAASPGEFSSYTYRVPRTFAGRILELRGWLRTDDVRGWTGLWMRQDGPQGAVQFDNMQNRGIRGTTEWSEYRIVLPLDDATEAIYLGTLLTGTGTAWLDGLELLVDGRPVAEAPAFVRQSRALEVDSEGAGASGISTRPLAPHEIENLALLAEVWGFAKYHHPRVAIGEVNWDSELFPAMQAVLDAPNPNEAGRRLVEWLDRLGAVSACDPCVELPEGAYLNPEIDWIRDRARLGAPLSSRLLEIYRNRPAVREQQYVSHVAGIGNPTFDNEAAYAHMSDPDAGYRLLGLFRFWNIIRYWFPYRDIMEEDWDGVLREFIPRAMAAETRNTYVITMTQLIARVHDGHANLWSGLDLRPPTGGARLPAVVRFVEGKAVVTGYSHPELGPASGLRVGDVIERIDGAPLDSLVAAWRPFYAASNEPTRLRYMSSTLTRGPPGPVRLTGSRAEGPFELTAERIPMSELDSRAGTTHDLPGPAFQRISDEVAYLKLAPASGDEVPEYLRGAEGSRVWVIDIRNYPTAFLVFSLGRHLIAEPTQFARFTYAEARNPGAFRWTEPIVIQPQEPRYTGRILILVDETTQSSAEYHAMAFRAAPNAIVVGSTTAGADGNVSRFSLPGGLQMMITGIGVFYPDRAPTQRIGIVPDLEVRPTIAGIREGRDEVLEAAVSHALGREFRLRHDPAPTPP